MSSFFGALLSWPVLVGLVVGVALVLILAKFLVNKPKEVQSVLNLLELAEQLIMAFMPTKYKMVYEALIAAVKRVTDGVFTSDEAISTAREAFAAALGLLGITLSATEQGFVDQILVFVINLVAKDKVAVTAAVNKVCAIKGYSF